DGDRVLVNEGAGTLAILGSTGTELVKVTAPGMTEATLQGSALVVHAGQALFDYDSTTGALLHEWPLQADSALADVQDGTALVVTSANLELIRLSDGQEAVVTPPGERPFHAQLEPPGLFYSYSVPDSQHRRALPSYPLRHYRDAGVTHDHVRTERGLVEIGGAAPGRLRAPQIDAVEPPPPLARSRATRRCGAFEQTPELEGPLPRPSCLHRQRPARHPARGQRRRLHDRVRDRSPLLGHRPRLRRQHPHPLHPVLAAQRLTREDLARFRPALLKL